MRWLEGPVRVRLTEASCGRKVNMLAEPEPAGGFGKGCAPLSQRCPTLYPGANVPDVRRAVARRPGGARRFAKPVGVTNEGCKASPFDDCAIIRRFYLSARWLWKCAFTFRLHH